MSTFFFFTLPLMAITISGLSFDYSRTGSTCTVRWYADSPFQDPDGVYHPAQAAGGPDFLKDVSCTVASNQATAPTFTLPATWDEATGAFSSLTAYILNSAGQKVGILVTQFRVPSTPSSTTWAALLTYNDDAARIRDTNTYTKTQTDYQIAQAAIAAIPATAAVLGRVRMSVAPVDAAVPIAVGDNDPRVAAATVSQMGLVSTTAQTFAGRKTFQDGLTVSGNTAIFAGTYLDLRPTTAQEFENAAIVPDAPWTRSPFFGVGSKVKSGLFLQHEPVNGLQMGFASLISSGTTAALPAGHLDNAKVAGYFAAQNTPGADFSALPLGERPFMFGVNVVVQQNASGSELWTTGVEVDFNRRLPDATNDYPTNKSVAFHAVSGAGNAAQYGFLVEGANGGTFLSGISVRSTAIKQRGIEINGNGLSNLLNYGGLIVGRQIADTGDLMKFQRATDSGTPSGSLLKLMAADDTTVLFDANVRGDLTGAGVAYFKMLRATDDLGGNVGQVTFTNAHNTGTARGAGVGTILFADGTSRNCVGFLKIYYGTSTGHIPIFAAN